MNLDHTTYDAFWKARSIWRHFTGVTPAVLTVGGWFDAEDLQGALRTYATIERNNPGITNVLVMGPWTHGGWARGPGDRVGHVRFGANTGEWFREHVEFPFFQAHLKETGGEHVAEATVFETGRNVWHQLDAWPPADAARKTLYLQAGGGLSWIAPQAAEGFDQYVSDPSRPVPLVGYVTQNMPRDYMTADQRFAATRPDVLVYETPPLERDVTTAGPVEATIYVSTTGTDSDFVVKLIDVYPADYPSPEREGPRGTGDPVPMGNYQQLVRGEPFRGKFRNGFDRPEPFTPGEPARIRLHDAGRLPHVPPRTPDHGAGAEQLAALHRSQSAEVHGHPEGHRRRLHRRHRAGLPVVEDGVRGDARRAAIGRRHPPAQAAILAREDLGVPSP